MNNRWSRGAILVCASLWLAVSACTPTASLADPTDDIAPMRPSQPCPGDAWTEPVEWPIDLSQRTMDLVVALDATISMERLPRATMEELGQELQALLQRFSRLRTAVVWFRDYPFSPYGGPDDYAWRIVAPFTDDETEVEAAVSSLSLSGAGDGAEAYGRVLYELAATDSGLVWRDGAKRVLLLVGDSFPHDDNVGEGIPPELSADITFHETRTGYPPTFWDPGRSGDDGVEDDPRDDIDFHAALREFDAAEGTLLVLYSNSHGLPLGVWDIWARQTYGGQAQGLGERPVNEAFNDLLPDAISRFRELRTDIEPPPYQTWVTSKPVAYTDMVISPDSVLRFDLEIRVPEDTLEGSHTFNLVLVGDQQPLESRPMQIDVGACGRPTPTPQATAVGSPAQPSRVATSWSSIYLAILAYSGNVDH